MHDRLHDHNRYSGPQHAPKVEPMVVTVVRFRRGQGCCEESLARIVTAYYSPDGELLFEDDPAPEGLMREALDT